MRIVMIGATGLIGRSLAPRLVAAHDILLIGRRPAGVAGADERIGPISEWPTLLAHQTIDVAISTLGTTWKQAGDWDAFRAVDVDAVIDFARAAQSAGARHFISVSTVLAHPDARNRYVALKGEAERGLAEIGFGRLDLVRPGLLRGKRGGDRRLGERIAIAASPLIDRVLRGRHDRFASIDADAVAAAMAWLASASEEGRFVHHNRDLLALAAG